MQAWRRLRHRPMPSSIMLCCRPNWAYASIRFCHKSSTSCAFSGRLAALYFEINVMRSGVFSGQKSGSSYKYVTLLHFWTRSSEWYTECQGRHSSRKRKRPAEYIKIITWYCSVYNQTAADAWRNNNPVYKLMTDKLQLMLINVLFVQFLNIKVSQGSVATRLGCDGIFNDHFITLLSPRVKIFLQIGQHLPKLYAIK